MQRLSDDELMEVSNLLESYHKAFYAFWWELEGVYFDDTVPTACIELPYQGKPRIRLGQEFWSTLDDFGKSFVICHELLHLLLDHGFRNGMLVQGATPQLVNVAQDITINHMIESLFGLHRDKLANWKKYCWIETCFKNEHLVRRNETFYYYLDLLITEASDELPETLDSHSTGGDPSDSNAPSVGELDPETTDKLAGTLAEELSEQELEELLEQMDHGSLAAGVSAGPLTATLDRRRVAARLNVPNLVKHIKGRSITMIPDEEESFVKERRRYSAVAADPTVVLPGYRELDREKRDKVLVAMFCDVSGSCMDYFDQFGKVLKAFEDEETVNLRAHVFDTRVEELDYTGRLRVGGGTNFAIIETRCLELAAELGRYPDCVVVLTDGEGTTVHPKAPERWVWLITPNGTNAFVPPRSRKHDVAKLIFD